LKSGFFVLYSDKEFEEAKTEKGALKWLDEKQVLDVQVDKMEAGLAGGPGKFQSKQLHSVSSLLPLSFSWLLCDSLFLVAWWICSCWGGCLLKAASAYFSDPLLSTP
jgi:hypothetical protein